MNKEINLCREDVMNNIQTGLACSKADYEGMQASSCIGKHEKQEDSYFIGIHPKEPNFKLLLVADGKQIINKKETISNIVTKEMIKWFENLPVVEYKKDDTTELKLSINNIIENINNKLKRKLERTTLCFAIVKNDRIIMVNIGDSRGYVLENNRCIYITKDDNIFNKRQMNIQDPFDRYCYFSNIVTNYIGNLELKDYEIKEIFMKDRKEYKIVICSDGITNSLGNKRILDVVRKNSKEISKELVIKSSEKDSYLNKDIVSTFIQSMTIPFKKGNERQLLISSLKSLREMMKNPEVYHKKISAGSSNATVTSTIVKKSKVRKKTK